MKKILYFVFALFLSVPVLAKEVVNVYIWGGEIPHSLIEKFEKETQIRVNFSTYDSNEVLYAKLKASQDYDVIMPSNYFVEKFISQDMLEEIDTKKLQNISNNSSYFLSSQFKTINKYSVPFAWSATGLFYNQAHIKTPINHWAELWDKKFKDKILILDDARETFSVALIKLGYSPNDIDINHIKQAYHELIKLQKNIKLLSTNAVQSLIIDEDVNLGIAWNGDMVKIVKENSLVNFTFPKEGFPISVDCFAILRTAPHKQNAYKFIDFMLRSESAAASMIEEGISTTNHQAYQNLARELKNNRILSPTSEELQKGILINNLPNKATTAIIKYWQLFKLKF